LDCLHRSYQRLEHPQLDQQGSVSMQAAVKDPPISLPSHYPIARSLASIQHLLRQLDL
ncbi:hypothetical protein ACJMK2_032798, partial [Sinanodonta woodiana]